MPTDRAPVTVRPNLVDYAAERAEFSWATARDAALDGLPDGGLNIAHEAVDRHVLHGRGDHVALRYLHRDGSSTDRTYAQLRDDTARFANVLVGLGVRPGERVFSLLDRSPALHVAALGTLRHRAVFCPLFSAFGPEPVAQRVVRGEATVLVTTAKLFHRKVVPVLDRLTTLRHVLLVDDDPDGGERVERLAPLLEGASTDHEIGPTRPDDPALLHFTSGTTGTPKGALHVHGAVLAHHVTATYALDLHPEDVYWCTADPGWVTGTSYGIVAPLSHGVTSLVDEGDLDADRWYQTLQDQHVTVWYTAPTAIRMLMRAGDDRPAAFDLSRLRLVASVGEPLSPDAVRWGQQTLGLPIRDNWWQTETGGIMIANLVRDEVRPGSMGRPLPGIDAAILQRDGEGHLVLDDQGSPREAADDVDGELALRAGWPSMFHGYLDEPERTEKCFADGWYLSGDVARRDADGWFWFVGRGDDVIKTAGHLVGPFEVEKVFNDHPAVAETGVIGLPDDVAGERIKAFVVPVAGVPPTAELERELLGWGRRQLGPVVAPREVTFVVSLPHTRSGKVMRRLLRARELGLDTGDTSVLEGPA